MKRDNDHREMVIRYLLGELNEEERISYEESYLNDDILYAELLIVESELIDSYVRGDLDPRECREFENYFMSSAERRRRVEIAMALAGIVRTAGLEPD